MATVNFYDTPLSEVSHTMKCKKGLSINDIVKKYLDSKEETVETYEVYNIETGETTFESVEADKYKIAVIVNGEDKDIDYVVKSKDIISVIIVPESNTTGADWMTVIGSAFMLIVGIVLATNAATAEFGIPLIIGGAAGLLAGTFSMITRKDENIKVKTDKLETEAALVINGAENQIIGDNNFPYVFGKIAENPPIIGSPYHETFTDANGKFNSQYMSALYCFGYGPLNITDFKIGETVLCFNRPRDVDGERENITVSHGFIDAHSLATEFEQSVANARGYYTYNRYKKAYVQCDPQPTEATFSENTYYKLNYIIPQKWKNNDITMEILQRGLAKEEDLNPEELHGTIYNKTVIEDQVNANLIYIHDEDLKEAAEKQYKGVAIPEGYRTNTVRLSQACPYKLEVEFDFSSSIYRTRSEKIGDTSEQIYYDIPIRYAVQWRPIRNDNKVSDAEDGSGWRSFDYLQLGDFEEGHWQRPKPYTATDALRDMSLNAGAKFTSSELYKDSIQKYAYDTYYKQFESEAFITASADAVYLRPYNGGAYYTKEEQNTIASSNASSIASKRVSEWADLSNVDHVQELIENDTEGKYIQTSYNEGWIGKDVFCINEEKSYTSKHSPSNFDGNERLYVFSKTFTTEEVKEILDSNSDKVEVRVIRITPNYIDEAGVQSESFGDFSYQDLGVWKYLRTSCFDKDAYKDALGRDSSANPADYPLRPIKESDLGKFTYVAVRLKQDVAETGGSSLKQLRAIVNSFSPVYSETDKKWYPETINKLVDYYQKVQGEDGKWHINKLSGYDEYMEKKHNKEPHLYKQDAGNDYVPQIAAELFDDSNVIETSPIKKYQLTTDLQKKYNNTNTASSVLLSLVGPQNGDLPKTYDDVNMTSATELFKFCEDVTDGTPYEGPEEQRPEDGLLHIKYSCNGIVSNPTKPEDLIKQQLITGRSILKRDDENRYEFFIGREQKYVMNVLNSKNVITESNTRIFEDTPSGFQAVFPDEADDYTQNPIYCMDKGEDWRNPTKPMEQISIQYVTNHNQLWSLMCFNLAGRLLQRETYTRTVGKMGLSLSIGDVMLLQGDSLIVGTDKGGRIVEIIENDGKIYGFTSDEPFFYTGETEGEGENKKSVQGVTIVQPNKYGTSRVVTLRLATPEGNGYITAENMKIGLTNIVALAYPIVVSDDGNYSDKYITDMGEFVTIDPREGDLLSFGLLTKITEKAQIVSIKPNGGKFNLSLVPYSDDYYQYGKKLPELTPKMTINRELKDDFGFTAYATRKDIVESKVSGDANKKDLSTDVSVVTTIKSCFATRDGIQVICDTRKDNAPVSPMSVIWRFYREDIVKSYSEPEEQPTAENFGERDYYALIDDNYVKQDTYDSSIIYYIYTPEIADTLLFEDETIEQSYTHIFDRSKTPASCNGYPEYYDLYPIKVTATAKLTVTSKTSESIYSRVGLDGYGTWIPDSPVVDSSVQDRTAILTFSQPAKQGRVLYGTDSLTYRVQIRKLFDGGSEQFAKPNIESSPYVEFNSAGNMIKRNESAYKVFVKADPQPTETTDFLNNEYYCFLESKVVEGVEKKWLDYDRVYSYSEGVEYYVANNEEVISSNIFTQTLPLSGQGDADSVATTYEYRVRAVSVSGAYTDYTENVQVRALVTNIRDIVRANATAKEEYVVSLSAISAKLGDITDGSLTGSELNYWTLSSKENARTEPGQDNRNYQGAFRVGGENQYLKVVPVPREDGTGFIDYQIDFKVGNFTLNSTNTEFNNVLYFYEDSDFTNHGHEGIPPYHTKRLKVTSQGLVVQLNNGTADEGPNSEWVIAGQITLDTKGNLIVSNTDESDPNFPKFRIPINGSTVYHFDNTLTDEQGKNSADLMFEHETDNPFIADASSPVPESDAVYNGKISKTVRSISNDMLFFCKKSSVRIGDDVITDSVETARNYNNLDKSVFGNENLPSDLFKYKE